MSAAGGLTLSRDAIEALLRELGTEMEREGARADLFVVGGAAIALAYDLRRLTADVDAVFEPKAIVYAAARRVSEQHPGLSADWLNDAVKGFLPGSDPDATVALDAPGVRVSVASPPYLLALKVLAARQDRDTDDIRQLARLCHVTTAAEVLAIAEHYLRAARMAPKTRFIVEQIFGGPA